MVPRYAFNAGFEVAMWTGVRALDYITVSMLFFIDSYGVFHTYNDLLNQSLLLVFIF